MMPGWPYHLETRMISTQPTKPNTDQKPGQCSGAVWACSLSTSAGMASSTINQRQDGAGDPHHRLQAVAQEFDELGPVS